MFVLLQNHTKYIAVKSQLYILIYNPTLIINHDVAIVYLMCVLTYKQDVHIVSVEKQLFFCK